MHLVCVFSSKENDINSALCPEVRLDYDLSLDERVNDSGAYKSSQSRLFLTFHMNLFSGESR